MSDENVALPQIRDIMKLMPHRYPFLLVDRVLECQPGEVIRALKNVTVNEPFFPGHFPEHPVMPGVLQLEALAQASLLLGLASTETDTSNMLFYFVGIDNARFKRPVVPGDQLILESRILAARRSIWKFETRALVDGEVAASAGMMAAPRKVEN